MDYKHNISIAYRTDRSAEISRIHWTYYIAHHNLASRYLNLMTEWQMVARINQHDLQ